MDTAFTSNDLLQLLYNEVPAQKAAEIQQALKANYYLMEQYQELREGIRVLPKATFAPSKNAIQNILNKSAQTPIVA